MKILTFTLSIFFTCFSLFSQVHKTPHSFSGKFEKPEDVNTGSLLVGPPVPYFYVPLLDTSGAIPGLTQYYDYGTNGNSYKKIWRKGDTVIIAAHCSDSLRSSIQSSRRGKYNFTTNGGYTWLSDPIFISDTTFAYPDLVPVMLSGTRTVLLSGYGAPLGGVIGIDIILGAGTVIRSSIYGSEIESAELQNQFVGCVYSNTIDSLFFRKYNYSTNVFSPPIYIAQVSTSGRYYIASSQSGTNVFIMWWNSISGSLEGRESTNGGDTFGSVITVCPAVYNAGGIAVTPWYCVSLIYKPGTTTPYAAFSTLATGYEPTAKGSKVLVWSPALNGGQPVICADWSNITSGFINDTTLYNNNLRNIQFGITPVSNPSIAFTSDGTGLACVFSTVLKDTSYYGFHFNNVFYCYSENGGANWSTSRTLGCPMPLTSVSPGQDQIYPVISQTGNTIYRFYATYSLSAYPGSSSFQNTNTPKSRVYQVIRDFCPTTLFGITTISNEIPKEFRIEQNYPNPFNPKTNIKFDILKASDVSITIYDVSGREVQRLVQQKLNAGKYSVDFDAGHLSSGVYFYSIFAGDFVQTKRMILIK